MDVLQTKVASKKRLFVAMGKGGNRRTLVVASSVAYTPQPFIVGASHLLTYDKVLFVHTTYVRLDNVFSKVT